MILLVLSVVVLAAAVFDAPALLAVGAPVALSTMGPSALRRALARRAPGALHRVLIELRHLRAVAPVALVPAAAALLSEPPLGPLNVALAFTAASGLWGALLFSVEDGVGTAASWAALPVSHLERVAAKLAAVLALSMTALLGVWVVHPASLHTPWTLTMLAMATGGPLLVVGRASHVLALLLPGLALSPAGLAVAILGATGKGTSELEASVAGVVLSVAIAAGLALLRHRVSTHGAAEAQPMTFGAGAWWRRRLLARRTPRAALVAKELSLVGPAVLMSLGISGGLVVALLLQTPAERDAGPLLLIGQLLVPYMAAMAGVLAVCEDRQLGTHPSEVALRPVATTFRVKLLTVVGTAIVMGLGHLAAEAAVRHLGGGAARPFDPDGFTAWNVMILVVAAVASMAAASGASSIISGTGRAALGGVATIAAFVLLKGAAEMLAMLAGAPHAPPAVDWALLGLLVLVAAAHARARFDEGTRPRWRLPGVPVLARRWR